MVCCGAEEEPAAMSLKLLCDGGTNWADFEIIGLLNPREEQSFFNRGKKSYAGINRPLMIQEGTGDAGAGVTDFIYCPW